MLLSVLDRFAGQRVVVVGDVMVDKYLRGDVARLSAEAPVPVVEVRHRSRVPGGAANAAANVTSLGGLAQLAGVVGRDTAARRLLVILNRRGVDATGIVADSRRPTTSKIRLLA
jgi:D-beta-D-heptose 7-phosphate kinase/D-beta-D-heptose 1-phosphate adenosyltransferase